MAKKEKQPTVILEREYIVPLRKGWLKVPEYKRASKAVKTLKEFIAKHMKVYDRDLRKIKIDIILNNEIRFRGMRKPPAKIKVLAKKSDDGIVRVQLVNIPKHIKFQKLREDKKKEDVKKKIEEKTAKKQEDVKKEEKQETEEDKEKEQAAKEEGLQKSKQQAKDKKHVTKDKNIIVKRKALSR